MKWHKKLKHRITCIFGIRDSRSRNQNRNNVCADDSVQRCTVQEDYPEYLNPFTSECSPNNDASNQYGLNPFEDENTIVNDHSFPTQNSSVETFANNLSKTRKYRKKYPAPKPPQSTCHTEKDVKVMINSPKRESDLKEEQEFKLSLKKTRTLSSPDPKQFNNLDSISSESPSTKPQYQEDNEKQICNTKVKYAGADMDQPFKKSLSKTQKSLSENDISSKKSQPRTKMSLMSKLQYSNSSPDLISETKVFNAIFFEDEKQFPDIVKNIKQETPLAAVSSLPKQETTENIEMKTPALPVTAKSSQETIVKVHRKAPLPPTVNISPKQLTVSSVPQQETSENNKMKTPVLQISVKPSQETIVKVHRKAPLPPTVKISPQQLTVSSLPQQEIAGNIKMKTPVLTASVKSRQETKEKVHRKAPLPPTVKISHVKITQVPKKTRMCKLQKFFTNAFMKN